MGQILISIASAAAAGCLLAGCATAEAPVAGEPQQICTREAPIGSNIVVTRCRSAEQIAREAEASRAALDAAVRPTAGRDGAAAGSR